MSEENKDIENANEHFEAIKAYIRDNYPNMTDKELAFLAEYLKTGVKGLSYQKVVPITRFGEPTSLQVARVMASKIIKKYNIKPSDFLDLTGHGLMELSESLERMKKTNPNGYVAHIIKLRGLDKTEVDINVKELPTIKIEFTDEKNSEES